MTATADAVVVGGGVVGASAAFQFALLGARKVVLCERRRPGAGASGRSGAFIQLHFCQNEPEARLTLASLPYFQHWDELVGAGQCGFVQAGYVRLEGPAVEAQLRAQVAMLRGVGANTTVIGPGELRELAPYLRTDDVAAAAYEPESGHADPVATVEGFLEAATQLGCELWTDTEVLGVRTSSGRVSAVETTRGPIATPRAVLAAGVWSMGLLDTLQLPVPLIGARTQAARFDWSPGSAAPLLNVGDGVRFAYFHSAGGANEGALVGLSGGARRPLAGLDPYDGPLDRDYAQTCLERLAWRLPTAAGARLVGGASGPIALTPDNLPILDRHPTLEGLYLFAGDCGSSFKTAPAVGRVLAEWALLGQPRTVDVSTFRIARFDQPELVAGETEYHRLARLVGA